MGTEDLKSFDNLQDELEQARNNLKGLNENIRRIIGREPPDAISRSDRKRENNRRSDFGPQGTERQRDRNTSPPPAKRRVSENPKSVFSRLSGPPMRDNEKPRILSRVIRELPTRQEIVAAQGADAQSRARNRRMFGCLLGTLQKFCQEESRLKPKEEKKAQIEKKLEEQEIQERENLKKERQNLFSNRKRQQQEIKILEYKMTRTKELAEWEESMQPLANYIRTKSKPFVYYLPKVMDKKSLAKLADSKLILEKIIDKKRQEMADDLKVMEARFRNTRPDGEEGDFEGEKHNNSNHEDYDMHLDDHAMPSLFSDHEVKREVHHKPESNNRLMSGIIVRIDREPQQQSHHQSNVLQSVVSTPVQHIEKIPTPTIKSEITISSKSSSMLARNGEGSV